VKVLPLALLAGLLGASAVMTAATGQPAAIPNVLSGAYTEAQALSGQSLYYQHCLQCHGEMMNGLDQAPPLTGPQFSGVWNGEPLWALVDRIGTMPPDKPGSLSRAESVDLLAYMLWFNGLPPGTEPLGVEQSVLAKMKFQTPQPAQ
jgi:mono/diheme cytochrome c family protein